MDILKSHVSEGRVDVVMFWRQLRTIGPILYLGMRRNMMRHWLTFHRELGLV